MKVTRIGTACYSHAWPAWVHGFGVRLSKSGGIVGALGRVPKYVTSGW